MIFTINKTPFVKALQRVQGTAEKGKTMPILANVLLEAAGGSEAAGGCLTVTATDLETFTKDICLATVEKKGKVTVSARKLFEIAKGAPAETISVSSDKDNKLTIKSGKSRFTVSGLPAADFPQFPQIDDAHLERMDVETLRELIDATYFAVSTDEQRYNINGFCLAREGGKLAMVATDGHRLAMILRPGRPGEPQTALMPRKGVLELRKLLGEKPEGEVLFGVNGKAAVLKLDDAVISLRLLEGEFPEYKKVIPRDNDKEILVPRADLLDALRRVSIINADKAKGTTFSLKSRTLTVSTSCPELGDAVEEIDVEYSGDDIETAFNAAYVIDALESLTSARARILLKDPLSPCLIHPEGTSEILSVVMPMRL